MPIDVNSGSKDLIEIRDICRDVTSRFPLSRLEYLSALLIYRKWCMLLILGLIVVRLFKSGGM